MTLNNRVLVPHEAEHFDPRRATIQMQRSQNYRFHRQSVLCDQRRKAPEMSNRQNGIRRAPALHRSLRDVTCQVSLASYCKRLITANRFLTCGFPLKPNIRIKRRSATRKTTGSARRSRAIFIAESVGSLFEVHDFNAIG
jgi:hypothetical protein